MKLLPCILFEKYISILALEMASPGNRHCANCIGALLFPVPFAWLHLAEATVDAKQAGLKSSNRATVVQKQNVRK